MTYVVQLVFGDRSLGGTSRSALQLGRAWASLGADVHFRPQLPIHSTRLDSFRNVGMVHNDVDAAPAVSNADLVHLHHGGWSKAQIAVARRLLEEATAAKRAPTLLTHNVFAIEDHLLDSWPSPRTVGVLAAWGAAQYRCAMGYRMRHANVAVIPNAQDITLFRPPTPKELTASRARLQDGSGMPIVLRIGSPIDQKWSPKYVGIVRRFPNIRFIFVGAPALLMKQLKGAPNVVLQDVLASDDDLLSYYWAADLFLHLASRGESFGNVILESILCGTPVVSMARPFRDNAPWEFQSLPGFTYGRSDREVFAALQSLVDGRRFADSHDEDRKLIQERYSTTAVAEILRPALTGALIASAIHSVGPRELAMISVRHNPVASSIKKLRQRLL